MAYSWKRNLYVLCGAQFLTLLGFSMYMSFIPYYLQTLVPLSDEAALIWTASIQTGGAVAMMIAAPIWGGLADRFGRKLMVVRATGAAMILAFLLGLVRSPVQFLVLRVLQGAFCGTVAAATTLVATGTPEHALGRGLGIMQLVRFASHAIGPLLGGVAADTWGYRVVFPAAAGLMLISVVAISLYVREDREALSGRPARGERTLRGLRKGLAQLASADLVALIAALAGTSLAASTLSPVLPLYIKALSPSSERLASLAGAVTSVSAVFASAASLGVGYLGDRVGQKRALLLCTMGVALAALPQAFAQNTLQLTVFRAFHGMFIGGIMPTASALLVLKTPSERRGAILGLSSGAQSGGRALGPVIGAAVSAAWGMPSAFLVNGGLFGVLTLMVALVVRTGQSRDKDEQRAVSLKHGPVERGTR